MPATAREWLVFLAGLCIVGVLITLVVDKHMGNPSQAHAPQTGLDVYGATQSEPVPFTTSANEPTDPSETAPGPESANVVRLLVRAARGDSWIMVRSGSATGTLLFQGTLVEGRSLRASARVLWIRIGAGAFLDARLNGGLLQLQPGTFDALVTSSGLELVP